jgi:hypothetical protein
MTSVLPVYLFAIGGVIFLPCKRRKDFSCMRITIRPDLSTLSKPFITSCLQGGPHHAA